MKKVNRLPREESFGDGLEVDGMPMPTDTDVEGHRGGQPDAAMQRLPGTGGDFRRPTTGGEATDGDDVEGHLGHSLPGTGGDLRRPTTGGETTDGDDIEGQPIS